MTHNHKTSIFSLADLSRQRRITLLVLRILILVGITTFLIMLIVADRSHMTYSNVGLICFVSCIIMIIFIIPELTAELLIRDFFSSGIYNISHKIRLIVFPLIYAVACAVSPLLFHAFFNLFATSNRTMGGNTTSLQFGIWQTLYNPPPTSFPSVLIIITSVLFLLLTTLGLCYLTLSKSKWRSFTAIILFILMEAAAALAAYSSPG